MAVQINRNQNTLIFILIGLAILEQISQSESAKAIGLDVVFGIILAICTVLICAFLLKKQSNKWKNWKKLALVLLASFFLFKYTSEVIANWSHIPWIKAKAFVTVDEFMNSLRVADYDIAVMKLAPKVRDGSMSSCV